MKKYGKNKYFTITGLSFLIYILIKHLISIPDELACLFYGFFAALYIVAFHSSKNETSKIRDLKMRLIRRIITRLKNVTHIYQ